MISTAAGVLVFLLFLLFAVQLLFGLYATSTVTAVAHDAALRAAAAGAPPLERIEADARRSLGEVGSTAGFTWGLDDTDGDGAGDTVVLEIVAAPPRFLPASISTVIGQEEIRRVVRVRVEQVAA
jgi:hypothetical protein